jgi:hypothetical protein
VELLLYEAKSAKGPNERIPFNEKTGEHPGRLPSGPASRFAPSLFRGWTVQSSRGIPVQPLQVLMDSCAKAIGGTIDSSDTIFAHRVGDEETNLSMGERDSGSLLPKCAVIDPSFDWEGDKLPRTPLSEIVVYELHVKGFTQRHPEVGRERSGGRPGPAGDRIQGGGQGISQRRSRSDTRRRPQPRRRGPAIQPDHQLPRHRQSGVLPNQSRNPRYHLDFGTGNSLDVRHPNGDKTDHGQPDVLGVRVGHSFFSCRQDRASGTHRLTKRMCAGATLGSSFT